MGVMLPYARKQEYEADELGPDFYGNGRIRSARRHPLFGLEWRKVRKAVKSPNF